VRIRGITFKKKIDANGIQENKVFEVAPSIKKAVKKRKRYVGRRKLGIGQPKYKILRTGAAAI